jgi:hypothetical protein
MPAPPQTSIGVPASMLYSSLAQYHRYAALATTTTRGGGGGGAALTSSFPSSSSSALLRRLPLPTTATLPDPQQAVETAVAGHVAQEMVCWQAAHDVARGTREGRKALYEKMSTQAHYDLPRHIWEVRYGWRRTGGTRTIYPY